MTIPSDTSAAATSKQVELLRTLTNQQRGALAIRLSNQVINLSRRAIARAHPEWSDFEVKLEWVRIHYGSEIAETVRRQKMLRDRRES